MVNDACKDSFKEFTDEPTLVCLPPSKDVNNEKEKQEVKNLAEPTETSRSDSKKDLPSCDDFSSIKDLHNDSVTFSNPLFEFDVNFNNPLFDEELEDIECKDSYDSNLDESTFLVMPLSDSNKEESLIPRDNIEFLLHDDPSTPLKSVASILEGFINDPPFKENKFDLKCKTNDEAECFNPGDDDDKIDGFLAIGVPTYEGHYDSDGDSSENLHTIIESLPTSTTLIENSDPNREEIDIFSEPDDSIPLGIESDFDSEEDIIDNLLKNDSTHERLTFNIEPDAPVINNVDELNEDECFDPA
ncbi:hypothetical protein Tco_1182400 [Tanacetum coccineum]